MTDNEIIKALECCAQPIPICKECPCYDSNFPYPCADQLKWATLNLIDSQQAEIERLKDGCSNCCVLRAKSETISGLNEQIEYWQRGYNDLLQENKEAKSKAVKEFAERLCEDRVSNDPVVIATKCLVKEMVGDME